MFYFHRVNTLMYRLIIIYLKNENKEMVMTSKIIMQITIQIIYINNLHFLHIQKCCNKYHWHCYKELLLFSYILQQLLLVNNKMDNSPRNLIDKCGKTTFRKWTTRWIQYIVLRCLWFIKISLQHNMYLFELLGSTLKDHLYYQSKSMHLRNLYTKNMQRIINQFY